MTRYHQSGTRRDACALLYEAGELPGQRLKTRLESHYDTRLDPKRFYSLLEKLERSGHVERREAELKDLYSLTAAGERALLDHYDWLGERIAEGQDVQEE